MVDYFTQMGMPASLHLPEFLKDIKYQNPPGNENDCFKHYSSDQSIWEQFAANPAVAENLGRYMNATGCE